MNPLGRSFLLLMALAAAAFSPAKPSIAAGSVADALPAHAVALAQVALPRRTNSYAVVYRQAGLHLGVVRTLGGQDRLVWTRPLPAGTVSLTAPGPGGLFQAHVRLSPGPGAAFFAFKLQNSSIVSAIASIASGEVKAGEGVRVSGEAFAVRAPDLSHVGSVKYRIVTRYAWTAGMYREMSSVRVPDYPASQYPLPNGTVRTAHGDLILIRLEIANTEPEREQGLMYRKSLDADSGMVFVWTQPVLDSFYMKNTYVPLSVAFLGADGRIQEIQDMQPLTTNLHTPAQPYQYAIEVNQGFFARNGIQVGDTLNLHLQS
jgi:uncharacterized membrane protein (UPF0127 family)